MQKRIEERRVKTRQFFLSVMSAWNNRAQGKYQWLDVNLWLGCHPSTENTNHASFVNSNKCCWKEASNLIKHSSDPTKTKYDCLTYLFELYYDLMLSVASNASQNPWFEAFTGQH